MTLQLTMNKLFILFIFSIGFIMNAQIATNGLNNNGTNASEIGFNSTASNTVSKVMGFETIAG